MKFLGADLGMKIINSHQKEKVFPRTISNNFIYSAKIEEGLCGFMFVRTFNI